MQGSPVPIWRNRPAVRRTGLSKATVTTRSVSPCLFGKSKNIKTHWNSYLDIYYELQCDLVISISRNIISFSRVLL